MIKCAICERVCKSMRSLSCHVVKEHEITTKSYYDLYLREYGEGICENETCDSEVNFTSLNRGYTGRGNRFCSISCSASSPNTITKRKKTCLDIHGDENYRNTELFRETCNKKYGVDNISSLKFVKDKRKDTINEKYGVDNIFQSDWVKKLIREKNEECGKWLSKDDYEAYEDYYKIVWSLTNRNKKELFDNWDGYDYYDNELILNKSNGYNDSIHPSIDHKISVREGFVNGKTPQEISSVDNLCITKRILNIRKSNLSEEEFIKKIRDVN